MLHTLREGATVGAGSGEARRRPARASHDGWASVPWSVAVASPADVAAAAAAADDDGWLDESERAACGRLVGDAARADFRASRLAARRAVAGLNVAAGPLSVSLTHRLGRGAAVATTSRDVRVGVDLEVAGGVAAECARYFLTAAERRAAAVAGARLDLAALWALKEAAWKALDVHDTVCFSALELTIAGDGAVRGVVLDGRPRRAAGDLSAPWPGFVLAVVRIAAAEASS